MKFSRIKLLLAIVVLIAISISVVFGLKHARDENKNARIKLYQSYLSDGRQEIAGGILWGLLSEYPDDQAIRELADAYDERIKAEKNSAEKKWKSVDLMYRDLRSLQTKVSVFKNNVEGFQERERVQWVEEVTAREFVSDTDYLFRLLKQKRSDSDKLSAREIEQKTASALESALNKQYQDAKASSLVVLRTEPTNATAAAIWCYVTVVQTPESVENKKSILPVVEYISNNQSSIFLATETAGIIYKTGGEFARAETCFKQVFESRPTFAEAKRNYIDCLNHDGKFNLSLPLSRQIWESEAKTDANALLVWQSLFMSGSDEKKSFLSIWRTYIPSSALPYTYLGDLALADGNSGDALAWYRDAEIKNSSRYLIKQLCDLYLDSKEEAQSINYLRKYLTALNPNIETERPLYLKYSLCLIEKERGRNDYGDVVSDASTRLSILPDDVETILYRADAYRRMHMTQESIADYDRAAKTVGYERVGIDLLETLMEAKKYIEVKKRGGEMLARIVDSELKNKISGLIESADKQIIKAKK